MDEHCELYITEKWGIGRPIIYSTIDAALWRARWNYQHYKNEWVIIRQLDLKAVAQSKAWKPMEGFKLY